MHSIRVAKQGLQQPTEPKRKLTSSEISLSTALIASKAPYVLVVEDNLMNQKIASCFLNRAQMPHQLACNGREALNIITQGDSSTLF